MMSGSLGCRDLWAPSRERASRGVWLSMSVSKVTHKAEDLKTRILVIPPRAPLPTSLKMQAWGRGWEGDMCHRWVKRVFMLDWLPLG